MVRKSIWLVKERRTRNVTARRPLDAGPITPKEGRGAMARAGGRRVQASAADGGTSAAGGAPGARSQADLIALDAEDDQEPSLGAKGKRKAPK